MTDDPAQTCCICHRRPEYGYRSRLDGQMDWYCAAHRLGEWYADARANPSEMADFFRDSGVLEARSSKTPAEPFVHLCEKCGAWGSFGIDVHLRDGKVGRWFCAEHRPPPRK
jgi:hypothetical protein